MANTILLKNKAGSVALGLFIGLSVSACDGLLEVDLPHLLTDAAIEDQGTAEVQVNSAIARLRMQMGDFDAAEELLAGAGGGSREDLYNLGEVEFAKGDVDAAAGWYEKAAALDPTWAKPFFKLALVQLNKGDMEGAKVFFAQVVEKDPSSEEGTQAQARLDALP